MSNAWNRPLQFGKAGELPPVRSEPLDTRESFYLHRHFDPRGGRVDRIYDDLLDSFDALVSVDLRKLSEASKKARQWLMTSMKSADIFEAVPVRSRMNVNDRKYAEKQVDETLRLLSSGGYIEPGNRNFSSAILELFGVVGIRLVRSSMIWTRDDPVMELPPGASVTVVTKWTAGVTEAKAVELSKSLGVTIRGFSLGEINGQIAKQTSGTVSISRQEEFSQELTLRNDDTHLYRRFALWERVEQVEVAELVTARLSRKGDLALPKWRSVSNLQIPLATPANVTSAYVIQV